MSRLAFRRWSLRIGVAALGGLLAACGGQAAAPQKVPASKSSPPAAATPAPAAPKPETVTFQTDFLPTGWDTGYWVALDRGDYKKLNLTVHAEMGKGSFQTAEAVGKGTVDFGQMDGGTMVQAIDEGLPAIGVASLFKLSPAALIVAASSNITSIAGLKGRKIGDNAADATAHMLPGVLAYNHMTLSDVNIVNMANSAMVPALLQHRVAAIDTLAIGLGAVVNVKGMPTHDLLFDQNGMHLPGDALAANRAFAQAHPGVVRRFVQATRAGWSWARQHPSQAVAILRKYYPTALAKVLSTELKLSLPFWQNPPVAAFNLNQYRQGQAQLLKYRIVKHAKPIGQLVTNAYIPKT